jgi:DNA-binding response OmpR family regulator
MARPKKRSILLIDQDVRFSEIYEKRFETAGWKVMRAKNFQEGKKKFLRTVPDAVIIDLHPLLESIPFLEELKDSQTLCLVLTDVGDRRTIKEVESLGVAAYLLKGHSSPSEVIRKVKSFYEKK